MAACGMEIYAAYFTQANLIQINYNCLNLSFDTYSLSDNNSNLFQ